MFGRSESAQMRTLLRLIESQQRIIAELVSQNMHLTGRTWMPPPPGPPEAPFPEEEVYMSALDGLPPTEEEYGTESD